MTGFPFGQTLTIVRGAKNLRTGVWTETSRHDLEGCGIDTTSTVEVTSSGDSVTVNATVYAPYGADAVATDRAFVKGNEADLYDVYGPPVDWANPITGETPGTVIKLVLHKG